MGPSNKKVPHDLNATKKVKKNLGDWSKDEEKS